MDIDVERKFRVKGRDWVADVIDSSLIKQCYISFAPEVRVRIQTNPDKCTLTVLGDRNADCVRQVFEYVVEELDAIAMFKLSRFQISKNRHTTKTGFVIDEISDGRQERMLVLAEIKVSSMDAPIHRPNWLGQELTGQPEYSSAWLAKYGIQLHQLDSWT